MRTVSQMTGADWSVEQTTLYGELHAIRTLVASEEQPVQFGGTAEVEPDEDVTTRTAMLDALAGRGDGRSHEPRSQGGAASQGTMANDDHGVDGHGEDLTGDHIHGSACVAHHNGGVASEETGTGHAYAHEQSPGTGHAHEQPAQDNEQRRLKYPRVDPPSVEDGPGQAVREDEPGYIAKAFPKLFPHGAGDFHHLRTTGRKLLSFPEWGRYVLMWHDCRFMRHTRFRYWLLDTVLRTKTPGMQRCFFRMRPGASDVTLADLQGSRDERKKLVQLMSTVTSQIPGSVGERRKMRQELEAMVHQIEAETADAGENGGAGRIPAGFCTLTCPVYKWEQLYEVVLRSYDSGEPEFERYTRWIGLPDEDERAAAMRTAFYELAVANPGAVAWYCGLKLEMAIGLVRAVLTKTTQD